MYQEDIISELQYITKLSKEQIVEFVQSNVISYSQLKEWYLATGNMPNPGIGYMIYKQGVNAVVDLWRSAQPKIDIKSVINALNKLGY